MPGDWVLIHVGFAMSKISEQGAHEQMQMLRMLGEDRSGHAGSQRLRSHRDAGPKENVTIAMKFVDEFRDPDCHRANRGRDPAPGRSRAPLSLDGSVRRPHPRHLSLRPEGSASATISNWCMVPAARCACCPWAASTTACRSPRQPDVIFTAFGDMMRVPGAQRQPAGTQGARRWTCASSIRPPTR